MTQPEINPVTGFQLTNLLLLHLLPGVGKRRLFELLGQAPFLLSEPVDRNYWLYVEKELRCPVGGRDQASLQHRTDRVVERGQAGEYQLLHWFSPDYPALLRQIFDPPLVLFLKGEGALLSGDCLAVVGARRASDYGVAVAQEFSARLAEAGLVIVSGLAQGIDSSAHVGALKSGGRTLAVLGTGIDVVYPKQARGLYGRLCREGGVVTEFFPGTYPSPQNFPVRNRVISGLSLGTLIVEATQRSGSLITARLALEQGRELFAIPGPVHSPLSVGPNYLIQQGAKLVQVWQDVAEELPVDVRRRLNVPDNPASREPSLEQGLRPEGRNTCLTSDEEKVYNCLLLERKVHLDTLLEQSGLKAGRLSNVLLQLQFRDLVQELPGHFFLKTVR